MPTTDELWDGIVNTKQNFSGTFTGNDNVIRIFRDNLRVWHKITRVKFQGDSEDKAVIIPFDTFFEPFQSTDDVDLTVDQPAEYDSTNHYFKLHVDALGNHKYLQSKIICFQNNRKIQSVVMTVECEYASDGSNAIDGVELFIYNGNEWIATRNNNTLYLRDYVGADLDSDLDTDLYASYGNYYFGDDLDADLDADLSGFTFQNKIKYKIVRTSGSEIHVKKVTIVVDYEF